MKHALTAALMALAAALPARAETFDLWIRNASIVDGTGAPAYPGDILVRDGVILKVGAVDPADTKAGRIVDAAGRTVAPGFIDLHSHGDPLKQSFENFAAMGVTTVTLGMDGDSESVAAADGGLAGWKQQAASAGLQLNVAPFTGHGTVRVMAGIDDGTAEPDDAQLAALQATLARELDAGSFGLSLGLEYVPGIYAGTREMQALGAVTTAHDRLIMSHMRSEDDADVDAAISELVSMAPGGRVHVSHLKVVYGKGTARADALLQLIAEKRSAGTRLTADAYPYAASFTGVGILFPEWALPPTDYAAIRRTRGDELAAYLAARLQKRGGPTALLFGTRPHAGQTLADAAKADGKSPVDLLMDIGPTGASAAHFVMDHALVDRLIASPLVALSTDGGPGMRHPRGYGSYARLIDYYVEAKGMLSLPEAVHKATGLPAYILGLNDRGLVKPGMQADLVLFAPGAVRERSSFVDPFQLAEGFDLVLVNGTPVFEKGAITKARPGKVLTPAGRQD